MGECPGAIPFGSPHSQRMRTPVLLLVVPLAVACSAVEEMKPDAPTVTTERISLTKTTPAEMELLVELGVHNPNAIALEARSVIAKVVLDDTYDMGTIEIPQEIDLPSKQQIRVALPVTVDVSMIASLIALKRAVTYDIDGTVKIGVELFKVTVPFHLRDVITEEQLRQATGAPPPSGMR